MGSVWAAVNESTSRDVAVKLILRPEPEFRIRLQREAKALGALHHKNIIDVYDIDQTEKGDPFLVMQLLTGETLHDMLRRKRRLEPHEAARIGRDIARALAAAHQVPIIHRDLKPANIFLHQEPGEEGEVVVKVLDFGVAKNLAHSDGMHTAAGGTVGSPLYMSPEQVRAQRDVDHRADLWSLGVVLFEMIAGQRPFDGDAQQVFAKILTGDAPRLDRVVRRIEPGLVDLVQRCLKRKREERPHSAAEVAVALEAFMTPRESTSAGWSNAALGSGPASGPPSGAYAPVSGGGAGSASSSGAAPSRPGSGPYPAYASGPYAAASPVPGLRPSSPSGSYPGVSVPAGGPRSGSGAYPAYGSGPYAAAPAGADVLSLSGELEEVIDEDDAKTIPIRPGMAQAVMQQLAQQRAGQGLPAGGATAVLPRGPQGAGGYGAGGQGGMPGHAAESSPQSGPGAWQQQQYRTGESWPRAGAHPSHPTSDPMRESGPWSAGPGSHGAGAMPMRSPQASSPEIYGGMGGAIPQSASPEGQPAAQGWAQGGTVKLAGNEAQALRGLAAGLQNTAPLHPGAGMGPGPGHPGAPDGATPFPGTMGVHSSAISTTKPLVSAIPQNLPPANQTMGATLFFEEKRKRSRMVAAVVGVLVGLAVAAGALFFITMQSAPERPELTPEQPAQAKDEKPNDTEPVPAQELAPPLPSAAPTGEAAPVPAPSAEPTAIPVATPSAEPSKGASTAALATGATAPATVNKPATASSPAPPRGAGKTQDPCFGKTGFEKKLCENRLKGGK
ncbi:serine/threonine-protein kinase [Chondromyces crocatus]